MSLPPALVLPLHHHVEGEVVHVSQDGKIWFTPASLLPAVEELMDKLAKTPVVPVSKAMVGQACTTMYSVDKELYRAKVTGISGKEVQVLYVDYGNEETKTLEEIMEIPEEFLGMVPAALPVNPARSFDKLQREEVETLLCGKEVIIKMTVERGAEVARIFNKNDGEIRFGAECLQGAVMTTANLGCIESLGVVWVVPTDVQGKIDKVTNILAEQTEWEKEIDIFVGKMCVAKYSEDQEMYRAMVMKVLGDRKVLVRFVDFGNTEETLDLWKLPPELVYYEDCAVRVKTRFRQNDSMFWREKLEEQLGKEEFLVEIDQSDGLAHFSRGGSEIEFEENSQKIKEDTRVLPVSLSYIESVSEVWVTPVIVKDKVDNLMFYLASLGDRLDPVLEVLVGSMVVTRYELDQELYRAMVVEVMVDKVGVFFIDFGNHQVCDIGSIYYLPGEISIDVVPAAAMKVNIAEVNKFPDNEANRQMIEGLLDKESLTLDMKSNVLAVDGQVIKFSNFMTKGPGASTHNKVLESKGIKFNEYLCQDIEYLRENLNKTSDKMLDLDDVLVDSDKGREEDGSTMGIILSEKPLCLEVLEDSASPDKFQASAAKNRHCGRWSVGDKVVAFIDNMWREVVIHEVHKKEAYVIPVDQKVKPALVDFSYVKSILVPLDALNKMESDIAQKTYELNNETMNVNAINTNRVHAATNICSRSSVTLTPSLILSAEDDDLCTFARTGAGSRYLQSLVSPENKKLCEKVVHSILSTNPLRMMTNPVACFLVQKIVGYLYILPQSQQVDLLAQIRCNFPKLSLSAYGYHVVKAAINHLGLEEREELLLELENKTMLLSLLKNKYGTFVAQACVPYLQARTVTYLVNNLLGHVVELSCHPSATFFIQQFLSQWGQSSILDMIEEDILRHMRDLIHHPQGAYVVQALLKVRGDYTHLALVSQWVVSNMQAMYRNKPAVQVVRFVLYLLAEKTVKKKENQWSKLLGNIVEKMLESDDHGRPHLIQAASHSEGCMLVMGMTKVVMRLDMVVGRRLSNMLGTYRTVLMANTHGCHVLKNLQGMMI